MPEPRPLRLLMVIHTPWTRNLGGPQAQIELAEELRALGDEVEKYSYEDAFPPAPTSLPGVAGRIESILRTNRSFAARAAAWVRAHGRRFDVIDAHQTDLPFAKADLGFSGLLVARSVGLIPAYEEFERWAAQRWPEPVHVRDLTHRALTWPGRRRRSRDVERSFRHADLINVSNGDDLERVANGMGYAGKAVMFPLGLSETRRAELGNSRARAGERLAARTVAFIGTWNTRKGAKDWPAIARGVRQRVPEARFRLLGTGIGPEAVLRDFAAEDRPSVEVIPGYDSAQLPGLLARATVGAFPGYLEGFGLAVLEMLAAGLPTVTYDAPGPRETMRHLAHPCMVPPGDVDACAARLAERLTLAPDRWTELSEDGLRAAAGLSWREIARRTRETYRERWEGVAR